MHDVCLALFWHQHQPYYPDDVGGENPMPWVRLHGTKDYWGMAMLLKEAPEMHATINLVPSLLKQLLAYTESGHEDTHLRVSRLAPDQFSPEDTHYLMDNFFMVHPERMIRPIPATTNCIASGALDRLGRGAGKRFSKKDVTRPASLVEPGLVPPAGVRAGQGPGRVPREGQTLHREGEALASGQAEGAAWPRWCRCIASCRHEGQVELTTTPFYHPILPLLWDKRLARRAMPDVVLPKVLDGYASDAGKQIRMAVEFHEAACSASVPAACGLRKARSARSIIPAIAEAGIQWIATDEEILSCSTDGWVSRDGHGFLRNPEMLYRPWRVEHQGKSLQMVFRDHAMSDQIGFHYQGYSADHAVDDFFGKVEAVGNATGGNAGYRPTLLSIILDGENCWEYYPNAGVDFLRTLYRRVVGASPDHPGSRVRLLAAVSGHRQTGPPVPRQLDSGTTSASGSGTPSAIGRGTCFTKPERISIRSPPREAKPAEALDRAWEEMHIAEGSDWFWWFGDDHTSAQDGLFDRLFRTHLQNVYRVLDEQPPPELARPISQGRRYGRLHTQPTGLLNVKVDGRRTYFEWINAGHHVARARGGR